MKPKDILALSLAALMLAGCGQAVGGAVGAEVPGQSATVSQPSEQEAGGNKSENNKDGVSDSVTALNPDDLFSDRDFESDYDESKSAVITLTGSGAQCSSDAVEINGSTVTIKDEGTYIFSGTLGDGMIIVDSDKEDKIQLVLNGVNIHSKTCAPIYILQSDKVFITLAEGSENTLSNGGSFVAIDDNEIDGVVFSKEDVTLNGAGSLSISSPAGHGVVSKDELTVTGGAYTITCGSHALSGKDSVVIANSKFAIESGKDGVHAENKDDSSLGYAYIQSSSFEIVAEGDGISAESLLQIEGGSFNIDSVEDSVHANGSIIVNDGTFAIATEDDAFHADETLGINGGTINISESYEGLEGLHVEISGGTISLVASDDGINAAGGIDSSGFGGKGGNDMFGGRKPGNRKPGNSGSKGSITISGGNLYVKASGDGIDANGFLTISGGNTVICGPNRGDTATLDYDTTATITGGTFMGTGAMGMARTFSDSEQGVLSVNVGNATAGTAVTLADKDGNTLMTVAPEMDFSVVILSSHEIVSGETYTLTVGSETADFIAE